MVSTPDFLEDYCEFGENRVYVLLAIARAKEKKEYNNNSEPVIREVVEEREDLESKIRQLDHAASRFGSDFRLYISANPRNTIKAFFMLKRRMDDWMEMSFNGNKDVEKKFGRIDSEYKSVLQKDRCKDETNFIFDLDNVSSKECEKFRQYLNSFTEVKLVNPTPNGFHIVTEPFNYNKIDSNIDYELKTDGMIFLSFIGDS